jgi:hypothetical protein
MIFKRRLGWRRKAPGEYEHPKYGRVSRTPVRRWIAHPTGGPEVPGSKTMRVAMWLCEVTVKRAEEQQQAASIGQSLICPTRQP